MISCTDFASAEHKVIVQLISLERKGEVKLPLRSTALAVKLDMSPHAWTETLNDLEACGAVRRDERALTVVVRCGCAPVRQVLNPQRIQRNIKDVAGEQRSVRRSNGRTETEPRALSRYFAHKVRTECFGSGSTNLPALRAHFARAKKTGFTVEEQFDFVDFFFSSIDAKRITVAPGVPLWVMFIKRHDELAKQYFMTVPAYTDEVSVLTEEDRQFLVDRGLM